MTSLAWQQHRFDYRQVGFTVLREFIPPAQARAWAAALSLALDRGEGNRVMAADDSAASTIVNQGAVAAAPLVPDVLRYEMMDAPHCERAIPELRDIYLERVELLRALTSLDVITSPYARSRVSCLRYPANGGEQSWHYDGNVVTALLYLTDNDDGHTAAMRLDTGEEHLVKPEAGNLLLMRGREVWHRGAPALAAPKIVMPWNYYVEGDTNRPEGMDALLYGPLVEA